MRSPLLAEVLAERWTLAVLGELAGGARTFDDLRAALDGVPATTLASALAQGERDGLLAARRAPGSAETDAWYRVTELGRSLDHSLAALDNWIEVCGVSVEAARKRWDEAPR